MNKIWRVGYTEYLVAIRSKAFIIGIILLPVLMFGAIAVQHFARGQIDLKQKKFAVLDRTGRLYPVIEAQARQRNTGEVYQWEGDTRGMQIQPEFLPELHTSDEPDLHQLALALSDRVREQDLMAFLVIGRDVFATEGGSDTEVRYYTQSPTFMQLPNWLRSVINEEIKRVRFESADLDPHLIQSLTRPSDFKRLGLAARDESGEIKRAEESNEIKTFGVPAIAMFLLLMLVMTSAPTLMNNVLEEKLQKIAEVMISAVSPFQLMMGKLLGAMMVSLTLTVLYLGTTHAFLVINGFDDFVPLSLYAYFLLFQILAVMMFGSVCSAIGAACSEIKDSQNLMFPVVMFILIPMFTWMPVLQSPNSPFARLVSLFPPATPMLMLLRIAVPPGPPWWEVALGIGLTTCFMLACVYAAGKIFRIGILAQGQSASFKKMLSWILSK